MRYMILVFLVMCGVCFGALKWQDDSAMASKFPVPRAVFNGQIFGGQEIEVSNATNKTSVWDGEFHSRGGQIGTVSGSAGNLDYLWPVEGAGMFAGVVDFSPSGYALQKSVNGMEAYASVMDDAGDLGRQSGRSTLARSFVDCGYHTFDYTPDAHGNTKRRVLLFCEYVNNTSITDAGTIWFSVEPDSTAGDAGTWHDLFPGRPGGVTLNIRHFHGGKYIKGKGLYVFTGDSDISSSTLYCSEAEIPGLINASVTSDNTYFDLWHLGISDRDAWGSSVYSDDNILIGNTQDARIVDLLTSDSKFGYYIPDRAPTTTGNSIIKVDFYDDATNDPGSFSYVQEDGIANTGWYGGVSKSGLIYISTTTMWEVTDWFPGANGFAEIWCIDPESDEYTMVKRFEPIIKAGESIPQEGQFFGMQTPLFEYGGTMTGLLDKKYFLSFVGDISTSAWTAPWGYVKKQKQVSTVLNTNTSFQSGDTTGYTFGTGSNKIAYTSGSNEIFATDVVVGATSGASATVSSITLASGTWGVGDAAGLMTLTQSTISGVFIPDESLEVLTVESATASGFVTFEVIDDPTGRTSDGVLRCVIQNTGIDADKNYITPTLSASAIESLSNSAWSLSFDCYIDPSTGLTTSDDGPTVWLDGSTGFFVDLRSKEYAAVASVWSTLYGSIISTSISTGAARALPNELSDNTDWYGLMYLTDFQIVKGALPNSQIDVIHVPPTSIFGATTSIFGDN